MERCELVMDDDETSEKFKKILILLKRDWEENTENTVFPLQIETELSIKENEAEILLNRLEQRGHVFTPLKENDMFRITDDGITALETTYNPEYQEQLLEEQRIKEFDDEQERLRQEKREDKKHKDTIKWTKWGEIGAIIIGSIGAITGTISLIISTSK